MITKTVSFVPEPRDLCQDITRFPHRVNNSNPMAISRDYILYHTVLPRGLHLLEGIVVDTASYFPIFLLSTEIVILIYSHLPKASSYFF